MPFFTVQDDRFCFGDPIALYRAGKCVDVVMMAGNTGAEFLNSVSAKDETELEGEARRIFGEKGEEFLAIRESREKAPGLGYAALSGIECTVKAVFSDIAADGRKGYCYCFDPDIPGWDQPGTFHSSDLWFWFETLAKCWRPFTGRHYDLARQMCDYFCNFIRSGDPNGQDLNGELLGALVGADALLHAFHGQRSGTGDGSASAAETLCRGAHHGADPENLKNFFFLLPALSSV